MLIVPRWVDSTCSASPAEWIQHAHSPPLSGFNMLSVPRWVDSTCSASPAEWIQRIQHVNGFNMLSIPQSSVTGSQPIHKSTGWRETVCTTAVQQGVYRWVMPMVLLRKSVHNSSPCPWFMSMVLLRKSVHNSSPTRSLQVSQVNGATAEKVWTTAVQQGVYRWFMLMVLLQKRSAQQQSNKEFTGDSC